MPRWANTLVGGWDLGGLAIWESGAAITAGSGRYTNVSYNTASWLNYTGTRDIGRVSRKVDNYDGVYFFDPNTYFSKFAYPGMADYGNAGTQHLPRPAFLQRRRLSGEDLRHSRNARKCSSARKPTTCLTTSISPTRASASRTLRASARSAASSAIRASCKAALRFESIRVGQASGPVHPSIIGGVSQFPIFGEGLVESGPVPRITSLLIKPASAVCNLDCEYCFYLDRDADPYSALPGRRMTTETLERLVDTYLFYSYPNSTFAFQGGEPTLAGLPFFEKLVRLQQQYGRNGQAVSNALQTNAVLLDKNWCDLFREYHWLLGVSLDGPEEVNDLYRFNKEKRGTWKRVMQSVELLKTEKVEFNILCVLSQANVHKPRELYKFYRGPGHRQHPVHPARRVRARRDAAAVHDYGGGVRPLHVRDLRPVVAGAAQDADPHVRQYRRGAGRAEARATARCTRPATATWWWNLTATSTLAISSWRAAGSWGT